MKPRTIPATAALSNLPWRLAQGFLRQPVALGPVARHRCGGEIIVARGALALLALAHDAGDRRLRAVPHELDEARAVAQARRVLRPEPTHHLLDQGAEFVRELALVHVVAD